MARMDTEVIVKLPEGTIQAIQEEIMARIPEIVAEMQKENDVLREENERLKKALAEIRVIVR